MNWNCDNNTITDDIIEKIETKLGIQFPKDFINCIKKYDGGYPKPNKIMINGKEEILNNLISFKEDDISFILDIVNDMDNFSDFNLVPIAEDPFGNLYCYSFKENGSEIAFWEHEDGTVNHVCNSFEELLTMLY